MAQTPIASRGVGDQGITFRNVGFEYPSGLSAIHGLDLSIRHGSSLAVVGPSGCGKSTLLQLISGLRQPTRGTITGTGTGTGTGGGVKSQHPLAMVFQGDTLLPWLTAQQNVGLHFRFRKAPKGYVKERTAELLAMVNLSDFADAYPYELSGGMRRRVAFLAAVAPKPRVLLLDEPFSSLDEPTRVAIHGDALRIMGELDMTTVLVTHDLAEAITLCDEIAILSNRPSHVAERHVVDVPRDVDPLTLRQRPDFLKLYGRLWEDLSRHIRAGAARSEAGVSA